MADNGAGARDDRAAKREIGEGTQRGSDARRNEDACQQSSK
jgi:hypothetical protein